MDEARNATRSSIHPTHLCWILSFRYCHYPGQINSLGGVSFVFLHEMVHVWQKQSGRNMSVEKFMAAKGGYDYILNPAKKLSDYNIEQQGEIIADYFMARL